MARPVAICWRAAATPCDERVLQRHARQQIQHVLLSGLGQQARELLERRPAPASSQGSSSPRCCPRFPWDDRELPLLFHARTADFRDVTAQATVTYRVTAPGRHGGAHRLRVVPCSGPNRDPRRLMAYWWDGDAQERFWVEIRKAPGIGTELICPTSDEDGGRDPWYELVAQVRAGAVIYHWSAREHRFVGRSEAAS